MASLRPRIWRDRLHQHPVGIRMGLVPWFTADKPLSAYAEAARAAERIEA